MQVRIDVIARPDELIAMGGALSRAGFAPGEGFQYSSVNTVILGRILEEITGQSYGGCCRRGC